MSSLAKTAVFDPVSMLAGVASPVYDAAGNYMIPAHERRDRARRRRQADRATICKARRSRCDDPLATGRPISAGRSGVGGDRETLRRDAQKPAHEILTAAVLMAPFVVVYGVLFIYPTIKMVELSFTNAPLIGPGKWVGFDNFSAPGVRSSVLDRGLEHDLFRGPVGHPEHAARRSSSRSASTG